MNARRRPLIAGNWKMNQGGPGGLELARAVAAAAPSLDKVDIVISPPSILLAAAVAAVKGSSVGVAAQNVHSEPSGAFTGELSVSMLVEHGVGWVILGHSERRQYFGETDAGVKAKTARAFGAGLVPIVCVGETLAEREAGKTLEVVSRQVAAVLDELAGNAGLGVIAYEPVWAIGTGKVAGPEQAEEVHAAIRQELEARSAELAEKTRILYGGSVKASNAAGLLGCSNVDGALVGGASLDAADFLGIAKAAQG